MTRTFLSRWLFGSVAAVAVACTAATTLAAGGLEVPLKRVHWPFGGPFGTVDRPAAQRGLQVYQQVCASCHGLKRVPFRALQDIGFSEAEVKAFAAENYTVVDGPDDAGDMFERPARPADYFVPPYPNKNAARAANGGAYPPDLSLMIKARPDGANYMYSLLTGYVDPPEDFELGPGMYYNRYFPGHQIAMPPPLIEDIVTYQDGTPATVDQMARDLTIFLQWAAEPEMEERKALGAKAMLFLLVTTIFLYIAKVRIWSRVKQ